MLELAREADWDAINEIAVQVHDLHVSWRPDLYRRTDTPYPKDYFLECIQNKNLFVAKLSGMVVGIVRYEIWETGGPGNTSRKVMRLDNIAVHEALRNRGIGKSMIADIRALAKVHGCQEIILSVYPQNDVALAFYQKCGFAIRTIGMDMKL